MILIHVKKSERPVSLVLALCLVFELAFPLTTQSAPLSGGGGTVASSLSSMVDGYTGDFHYSVPLVTVPGPNGESVSVSANYHAGITVNQKASWLGLGWDYNPGEITRQVINTPDDYNGVRVNQYFSENPYPGMGLSGSTQTSSKMVAMYGSLYNNEINTNPYGVTTSNTKSGDNTTVNYNLSAAERCSLVSAFVSGGCAGGAAYQNFDPTSNSSYRLNKHTVPYTGLAYDQYSVSGDGIGGTIHPYYLGDVQIHPEMNGGTTGNPVSSKKCQFYFENSTARSIDASVITNSAYVNQTTNRIHSGTFVKYFTNGEINTNSNLYSSTNPSGYLDYNPVTNLSTTRRPVTGHSSDVIGAFQVTTPSGMTYHYSLPVYALSDLSASFDGYDNSQVLEQHYCDYATSWKLTAITGADYEDKNANYTADEGDTGYWISYNYSLWSSAYTWASQRYNAKSDALVSPKMTNLITSSIVGNQYRKNNSLSFGTSQVYVLNYIQTATHTAYFVKSIRQDEQSYSNVLSTSVKPVASLKLDRVVLMRNEDKGLLINSTALGGSDLDSRFDYTTSSQALADPNFVNVTRYTANKQAIDHVALTTAELTTNYSLAKKYIGNINNSFTTSAATFAPFPFTGHTVLTLPDSYYMNVTGFSSTSQSGNNGKLTLKKITIYNLNGEKVTPSVDFSYDESNATKNPDFDVDKTDLWGYYKSDYVNSRYVTAVSKDNVDAWSLKEINTSLGGKIAVTYESDRYHREGFNGDLPFYTIVTADPNGPTLSTNKPHLIFPITDIGTSNQVTFADNDFDPYYHQTNEATSEAGYIDFIYIIFSQIDQCRHAAVYYNNGNSFYYPPVYSHLVRYGTNAAGSTGSGVGPYATILGGGAVPEFNFNCNLTGYSFSSTRSGNVGVDHAVVFRDYLYGGGLRVNKISVTDPFSGNSYTQKFDYGEGYCPVVPKPMTFSTDNGPSNHDLIMNTKPQVAPQLTGMVGYNSCTHYSLNSKNETSGTIIQNFENNTIKNPLSLVTRALSRALQSRNNICELKAGSCTGRPNPGTNDASVFDYKMNLNVSLSNNADPLGKLASVTDGLNSTVYTYSTTYVAETNLHPASDVVKYPMLFEYTVPGSGVGTYSCSSVCGYTVTDTYNYTSSALVNNSYYLSSTTTIKDGITIREDVIDRDVYTGATTHSKVTDPTKGIYDSYTGFAYNAVASGTTLLYPAMNLKSKSESNRNLVSAVSSSRMVKNNAYVMSESSATYSNTYPLRTRNGATTTYGITNTTKPWYHLDETYERLLDDDVPITAVPASTDWRKVSKNTLYDASYNCIEQEGLNSRRTASRWGYTNLYKLASITNANYNSFTFSGFEDAVVGSGNNNIVYGGEVTHGETQLGTCVDPNSSAPIVPHTGYSLAGVAAGQAGPAFNATNFNVGRTYIAKVWVHTASPSGAALTIQLNGTAGSALSVTKTVTKTNSANVRVGDWILMSTEVEVPDNFSLVQPHSMSVTLSNTGSGGKAYFDDFAFHPKDAEVTGNVYDVKTGLLIAQLDNDNFATTYNYDNAMRLKNTYKEYSGGVKKISESLYHYAKP